MTVLRVRDQSLCLAKPTLMGVVNLNADSFSDPGRRTTRQRVDTALRLADEGAAIIDIGAQSSITRRSPVCPTEEAAAVGPVVRELVRARPEVVVSVDTFKLPVAALALAEGAHIINDVSGLRDPDIARVCAGYGAGLVIMHTSAPPLVRRQDPQRYTDVGTEVATYLAGRLDIALELGLAAESTILDPGPDFTKTPSQTIEMLRNLHHVVALGRPILLALSRKDFIGALTARPPKDRGAGTLGAIAAMRHIPAQILRVHDVAAAAELLAVLDALKGAAPVPADLVLADDLRHQ